MIELFVLLVIGIDIPFLIFLILISLLQASSFELSQQKETKLSQDHDIPGVIEIIYI